jgi:5-methylthioadenosine/S-adenosylhomocysteine deaminase
MSLTPPRPADLAIHAGCVVPVEPANAALFDHAVIVDAGAVVDLRPSAEVLARWAPAESIRLPDHVLIPGLVNAHTHAAMSLMRGLADDIELMRWLAERVWPAERELVSAEFVFDGTRLACAEMLRGGITCFNDMYFHPEAAARAALAAGMRAALGIIVIELPSRYACDAHEYLAKGLALRDALRDEPLLSFCLAPHAPYTVSDATLREVVTYAQQLGLPVHTHVHETAHEIDDSVRRHGERPLARLDRLGVVGPDLIAVHAVHLDPSDLALLARHGCHVVHCPSSNAKLGSGIAPVARLLEAGVGVALGTDGAASNNRLDLFAEMRAAALFAKAGSGRADAVPAASALRMATLEGARALGLDERIGSIVPGKRADLVAVSLEAIELAPCFDPVSHLVYAAGREHVTHVWVDGKMVLRDRQPTTLDLDELRARAVHWRGRMPGH